MFQKTKSRMKFCCLYITFFLLKPKSWKGFPRWVETKILQGVTPLSSLFPFGQKFSDKPNHTISFLCLRVATGSARFWLFTFSFFFSPNFSNFKSVLAKPNLRSQNRAILKKIYVKFFKDTLDIEGLTEAWLEC